MQFSNKNAKFAKFLEQKCKLHEILNMMQNSGNSLNNT